MKIADRVELSGGQVGRIIEFPGPAHAVVEIVPGGAQVVVHRDQILTCGGQRLAAVRAVPAAV
ncbi:MAG TPA: hypothetical protein VMB72_08010 [Acidimicrobiales bacterium]|nr:hypothetical protein [Acidimicrobiales bacterium]